MYNNYTYVWVVRWHEKDWDGIIGIFASQEKCFKFLYEHFSSDEIMSDNLKITQERMYND